MRASSVKASFVSVVAGSLVVSFLGVAFAAGHLGQRTLRDGDFGSDVTELQEDLTTLGYGTGGVDGQFGLKTEKAVRGFQGAEGLTVDGIVGSDTVTALENAVASHNNAAAAAAPQPQQQVIPAQPTQQVQQPFTPGSGRVMGVNVSKYEPNIDWPTAAANGVTFAFCRVSDGLQAPDHTFQTNWAGSHNAGVIRGAYQYFRASESAVAQADYTCDQCGALLPGDLPPALDLETQDGQSASTVRSQVRAWISEVKQRTGLNPIIYTTPSLWSQIGATSADAGGCDLWIANWGVSKPKIPTGTWSSWAFWQYKGDSGSVPGVGSHLDLDSFDGSQQDLINYAYRSPSGTAAPAPAPAPVAAPAPAPVSSGATLSEGDSGADVTTLQNALNAAGYSVGTADGSFGPKTKAAVEAFQSAHGLAADGIVGAKTRAALGI